MPMAGLIISVQNLGNSHIVSSFYADRLFTKLLTSVHNVSIITALLLGVRLVAEPFARLLSLWIGIEQDRRRVFGRCPARMRQAFISPSRSPVNRSVRISFELSWPEAARREPERWSGFGG